MPHRHHHRHHHHHHHFHGEDQESGISSIPSLVHALMFMASGFAIVVGTGALSYGFYFLFNTFSPTMVVSTYLVFPTLMLLLAGAMLPFFTFCGLLGVMKEDYKQIKSCFNSMKFFLASCIILGVYISASTYGHTGKHVQVPLKQAITNYHEDRALANLINMVQTQFKCCGVTNIYDWNKNQEFDCDSRNLSIQSCNVPYSCCVAEKKNTTGPPICRVDVLRDPLQSKDLVYLEGCQKKIDFYLISTTMDMGLLLTFLIITAIFVMRVTGSILLEYNRRRLESLYVLYTTDTTDLPPVYEEKEIDTTDV